MKSSFKRLRLKKKSGNLGFCHLLKRKKINVNMVDAFLHGKNESENKTSTIYVHNEKVSLTH